MQRLFSQAKAAKSFAPAISAAPRRQLHCKPGHRFDPNKILPSDYGHVRVISNTTRDAQQSNCSAEMADEHRQQITKLIDDCYKDVQGFPGYEQTWGGTIPMFDIWKRGVNPFDALRQQNAYLPNTPVSMLFRSTAITSMSNLPYDVIDRFIKISCESGCNVFTNFDAHNDWRNHVKVAESVQKHGGHYQAALSWAVYPADPTIYNVQWAVDFFKDCVKLGAHSLYVKDPSGVLTPEMAGALARQIKEAFPDKPLVFHTHYQTGYGYMTYLEAVKNGANGVECSIGFSDGAGQPYALTMLRAFEDFGFHTGKPNKAAMGKIAQMCKNMRPLYASASTVRTPDVDVEDTGIAGGQRTILDKELIDAGQPHLIPLVDVEVQKVRKEGGKVCQVTPVADTYAREAVRRLRGGSADSNFVPGFAGILVGEGGRVMDPVNKTKQTQVFRERVNAVLKKRNVLQKDTDKKLLSELVESVIGQMATLAHPTMVKQRMAEVSSRVSQLTKISGNKDLLTSLNLKIHMANEKNISEIRDVDEQIQVLKREESNLSADLKKCVGSDIGQAEYESILKQSSSDAVYNKLVGSNQTASKLLSNNTMDMNTFKECLSVAGFITCAASDLIQDGMPAAYAAIEQIEKKFILGVTESDGLKEELAVLQACFGNAAIPNLFLNFLKNYRENKAFWPALYTGHVRQAMLPLKMKAADSQLYIHARAKELIGDDKINDMVDLQKTINHFHRRMHSQAKMANVFESYLKIDPHSFPLKLKDATVSSIQKRVVELEAELKKMKDACGATLAPLTVLPLIPGSRPYIAQHQVSAIVNAIVTQGAEKE